MVISPPIATHLMLVCQEVSSEHMTFSQQLTLTLGDKAAIGVLILALGFWLNRKLERLKSDLEWKKSLAADRIKAYRQLWSLTQAIGGTGSSAALTKDHRGSVSSTLSHWYWEEGNGMLLSHAAGRLMMKGWQLLKSSDTTDREIRDHYSQVRTLLKTECGIYEADDATESIASN